jgi:ubiquinone/menaquinone biosynthesis C-methylase UbiE
MVPVPTIGGEESDYIWGRGGDEVERLIEQGRFLGELTEHFLLRAGIERGMRVLDVGCGAGDVSFLAARLVGPEGTVIGVDNSSEAIGAARERARQAGLANVEFIAHDAADLSLDAPVDALLGRLVLIFFKDPAAVLRRIFANVRPGGIVAFQEWHVNIDSEPRCELFHTAIERMTQTFARAGYDVRIGLKLRRIFLVLDLDLACDLTMTG